MNVTQSQPHSWRSATYEQMDGFLQTVALEELEKYSPLAVYGLEPFGGTANHTVQMQMQTQRLVSLDGRGYGHGGGSGSGALAFAGPGPGCDGLAGHGGDRGSVHGGAIRSDWEAYTDNESGNPYFSNRITGESRWKLPDEEEDRGGAASTALNQLAAEYIPQVRCTSRRWDDNPMHVVMHMHTHTYTQQPMCMITATTTYPASSLHCCHAGRLRAIRAAEYI